MPTTGLLTGSVKLANTPATGDFAEAAAAETAAEAAEALALEGVATAPGNDWTYSATAEGRTGEVAGDTGLDVDGEPGLIYSGPEGGAVSVRIRDLDITEGTIAPEATDTVTAAVLLNNDVIAYADEGFVALTGEVVHEMNADTYVGGLKTGDVLRVALVGGGEETVDTDVAVGGKLAIV